MIGKESEKEIIGKGKEEFNIEDYATNDFLKKIREVKEGMRKARRKENRADRDLLGHDL